MIIERRLANEMAAYAEAATIKVLPALCPLAVSPADFGHAAELIDRSYHTSRDWIADGDIDLPAPERFLSAHHHRSAAVRR